jgi:hypothetical protein
VIDRDKQESFAKNESEREVLSAIEWENAALRLAVLLVRQKKQILAREEREQPMISYLCKEPHHPRVQQRKGEKRMEERKRKKTTE